MSDADPFSPARRAALRAAVLRDGLLGDAFLSRDADVPTFGLNLACAWPFPEAWRAGYEQMATNLRGLGPGVYVYPFATTHVTLVTLVSFARHPDPVRELVEKLETRIPRLLAALAPLLGADPAEGIRPFPLEPQPPVLARGAIILPLRNADGEVSRLRRRILELLQRDPALHQELSGNGLNVPDIIHSTIARFRQPPPDLGRFLSAFDEIAAAAAFPAFQVPEVLLTTETKPYMRGGEVLRRWRIL